MLDIHSHIIFGVDDGPKTPEESLALLQEAYRQGVRGIVATSHRRKGMFETPEETIWQNFRQVQELAKQVADDLFIYYGAEIYYSREYLNKLEKKEIPGYASSDAVLVEFSTNTPLKVIQEAVRELLAMGKTPVLAHIERYEALEGEFEKIQSLIDQGAYMQINSSSVLKAKMFGDRHKAFKKRAKQFLDQDLVHFVASDMHNLSSRPPYMQEAYELISQRYGQDYAKDLFMNNPLDLLKNKL
ncbi:tyrosine protein phosphatase [Streptococcus suis]|uniref:Tyrosine-protein phosphatase n=1 Tax=Streptococcus suivaginalis TaxID=3028082 RepID=A0AA96VG89_9STRE|nr:CpsB/CapC family capsule biosynthesis tyrosine phosphatase [Streptococcus sp. 29896]MCK4027116.1 tyrosine protein phosphatase [Streptococcus suis]WNY47686.1 tyrosine protein phosphatase [Streptococcus sp. 29896]